MTTTTTKTITGEVPVATGDAASPTPTGLLANRNFRRFWLGEAISMLGDQFYSIALPWLVLQLTGNLALMGVVLALEGIPRAVFMLLGGALTDRFSPRNVMMSANAARMVLVGLLAALVFTGSVQIWMVMVLALLTGLSDSFFYAAQSAIIPGLVEKGSLSGANAITQGTMQFSLFLGPALAGVMIAVFGGATDPVTGEVVASMGGIALAFAVDALTFLASLLTLWLLPRRSLPADAEDDASGSVLRAIRDGLAYVWEDTRLRGFFILIAFANLFVTGPLTVGIPALADQRLTQGAAAFGIIMSGFGGGSLIGILLSGFLPRPPARHMGLLLGVVWSGMGVGMALLSLVTNTPTAAALTFFVGATNGYVSILFITWLQGRTPPQLMGRVMSLLTFASIGLIPISHAVTGSLLETSMTAVFMVGGSLMTVVVLGAMFHPLLRSLED